MVSIEEELAKPSARKLPKDSTVFLPRQLLADVGNPKLIYLGEALFEQVQYVEHVIPDLYRAPRSC